ACLLHHLDVISIISWCPAQWTNLTIRPSGDHWLGTQYLTVCNASNLDMTGSAISRMLKGPLVSPDLPVVVVRAAEMDGNAITYAGQRRSLPAMFVSLAPGTSFGTGGFRSDLPTFRRTRRLATLFHEAYHSIGPQHADCSNSGWFSQDVRVS